MRRKIQELIRGTYDNNGPKLLLEQEAPLSFAVIEKEPFEGSFLLQSSTSASVYGIVTCEHPAVCIDTPSFDARKARIRFTFLGEALKEGESQDGVFVVTSSAGELLVPFHVSVSRHYLSTSIGKIKTINDFTNLCSLNWEEALRVFASPYFCNIFHENQQEASLLYRALTCNGCSSHEMEQFLIAMGKKQASLFSVENPVRSIQVHDRPIQEEVEVFKSQWGHCDIRIRCDAPFVEVSTKRLYGKDFFGKRAKLILQLLPHEMHAGNNYAVVTLEGGMQKVELLLTCTKKPRQEEQLRLSIVPQPAETEHSAAWRRRLVFYKLERCYMAYCLQKKTKEEWLLESEEIIQTYQQQEAPSRCMNLLLAYVYWAGDEKERMEACMRTVPRNTKTAHTPLGGLYLYLQYLRNRISKAEVLSALWEIQSKYRRDFVLNWILLELDDGFARNPQRKYEYIRDLMEESYSAMLYFEAAKLLLSYPELLDSQDEFSYRLIGWMAKKNLLTKPLSLRIQNMAPAKRAFSRSYFQVLSRCYKKFGDDAFIKTICVYLINTGSYAESFFPYFKRGVEQQLKIAGLYEAYMLSRSRSQGEIPPQVVRYFSMRASLPAPQKAMLFAYIIRNRHRLTKDWQAYLSMVREFAAEELKKGHMSEDLAVIYEELRRTLPRDEWDEIKENAEHCYKVHAKSKAFAAVWVAWQKEKGQLQRTQITGDAAFVHLYQKPYVILYEGRDGLLYVSPEGVRISKMLPWNYLNFQEEMPTTTPLKAEAKEAAALNKERLATMEGPLEEMLALFLACKEELPSPVSCAQQLLIRMLFTGVYPEGHQQIYEMLKEEKDCGELLLAYTSVCCRWYMRKNKPLPFAVASYLHEQMTRGRHLNRECRIAFVRWFTTNENNENTLAEEHLLKDILAGRAYPFYEELPEEKKRRYLLAGIRVYAEEHPTGERRYATLPDGRREAMTEVLPGFYTFAYVPEDLGQSKEQSKRESAAQYFEREKMLRLSRALFVPLKE